MPLSPPAPRQPFHTRRVTCQGYLREDGLWDIEGHMTDEKSYPFHNQWRGEIQPGDFIHNMWLRLTIDGDFVVRGVEAASDDTPFAICPAIIGHYQRLVGLRIGPGWTAAVKERVGRLEGCTHLTELLGPMATTAFQTLASITRAQTRPPGEPPRRPPVLNTCHAWASDGEAVRRFFPDFYTGSGGEPRGGDDGGTEGTPDSPQEGSGERR